MKDWLAELQRALDAGRPAVRVVVAHVRGSAPREPGACMLVLPEGEIGTIGGGHLEFVATRIARDLLAAPGRAARLDRFPLGASLGQCCGGIVELWFQRYDAADPPFIAAALAARATGLDVMASRISGREPPRLLALEAAVREGAALEVDADAALLHDAAGAVLYERILPRAIRLWLFGAGHVATQLVRVLSPLPFAIHWVDSREDVLPAQPEGDLVPIASLRPADEVAGMAPGDWALVMTHSHDEDFDICHALLARGDFGWAGVIGSQPKAARFRQKLAQRGFTAAQLARLAMPIGVGGIRGKEPASIAIAVAAQLLQQRDARAAGLAKAARES